MSQSATTPPKRNHPGKNAVTTDNQNNKSPIQAKQVFFFFLSNWLSREGRRKAKIPKIGFEGGEVNMTVAQMITTDDDDLG